MHFLQLAGFIWWLGAGETKAVIHSRALSCPSRQSVGCSFEIVSLWRLSHEFFRTLWVSELGQFQKHQLSRVHTYQPVLLQGHLSRGGEHSISQQAINMECLLRYDRDSFLQYRIQLCLVIRTKCSYLSLLSPIPSPTQSVWNGADMGDVRDFMDRP